MFSKNKALSDQLKHAASERIANMLDYSVEEMLAQVEFDIPANEKQKEKIDNERIMIK